MLRNICQGDKWPLGMVTAFFMLTVGVSTILALTVSQQAAYLWLSFVLIGVLFLTTFTRTSRAPIPPFLDSAPNTRHTDHVRSRFDNDRSSPAPPYYVRIDPPPSYNSAMSTTVTIYPDNCEPPPYINVVIQNTPTTTVKNTHPDANDSPQIRVASLPSMSSETLPTAISNTSETHSSTPNNITCRTENISSEVICQSAPFEPETLAQQSVTRDVTPQPLQRSQTYTINFTDTEAVGQNKASISSQQMASISRQHRTSSISNQQRASISSQHGNSIPSQHLPPVQLLDRTNPSNNQTSSAEIHHYELQQHI